MLIEELQKVLCARLTKLFENHCPTPVAQQFLETSGGGKFPQKSVPKMCETVLMRKHKTNATETTAETLV